MLPCSSKSLSKKLQRSWIHRFQPPTVSATLPFLYPRWFVDLTYDREHATQSQNPPDSGVVVPEDHQLPGPREDAQNHKAPPDVTEQQAKISELEAVRQQRIERLPRARLKVRSSLEQSLMDRISAAPTYKTARKDIATIFEEIDAEEAAGKKARLAWMREVFRPDRIDWVPIARKLGQVTDVKSKSLEGTRLALRKDFLKHLAGPGESNMWVQRVGTGTEVHLLPATTSTDDMREVILHGSPRSIELAEKALRRLQDDFHLSGGSQAKQSITHSLRKGLVVSVSTFLHYVASLVTHNSPRQAQQETGETLNDRIAAALVRLFLDPAASKYASTYALYRALTFISKHDELEATTHTLYERAQRLGLKVDISCFNLLLKQAFRRNNAARTSSLVADMRKSGIPANGLTWFLFFAAASSHHGRLTVLSLMRKAGVEMREHEITRCAEEMVKERLVSMADSSDVFADMLNDFDRLLGLGWLNASIYRRLVLTTMRRRRFKPKNITAKLLELPAERAMERNLHVEGLTLALHRHQRNVEESVQVLLSVLQRYDEHIPRMHVAYAFMTAWDRRWANVCRVLWRHAASHGNILDTMQTVVNRSLLRNTSESAFVQDIWWRYAGSIIAGTNLDSSGFDTKFPRLSRRFSGLSNPMEWLTVYTPDDGTRDEQISLAYLMINRDLRCWKRHRPMENKELEALLHLARKTDQEWKSHQLLKGSSVSQLLARAVPVDLGSLRRGRGVDSNAQDK
jgi:hypothetical protein